MKENEKGYLLGFSIIGLLVLLLCAGKHAENEKAALILTSIYLQGIGAVFLFSYFFTYKTFLFRGIMWVCEHFSRPKGRKMAFFYATLSFALGIFWLIEGVFKKDDLAISKTENSVALDRLCFNRPPQLGEFSAFDAKAAGTNLLLSTSFENAGGLSESAAPFFENTQSKISRTDSCRYSGHFSMDMIAPDKRKKSILPFYRKDPIESGALLSASFEQYRPFHISEFKTVKLAFTRFSTSNSKISQDFNCGSSLNVFFRIDGKEWKHKMAYCGQHLSETTGWRESFLEFDIDGKSTIEFLFSYDSLDSTVGSMIYLVDDLSVTGIRS